MRLAAWPRKQARARCPDDFTRIRDSDVFPTNNTMLRTTALHSSGLFDLAYERGERADGDLGMRLYLAGQELVLTRPPAWFICTRRGEGCVNMMPGSLPRAASRGSLGDRHLLAPTEAYLWCRYYTMDQVREATLIRTLGTLRGEQKGLRRLIRMACMTLRLPDTRRKIDPGWLKGDNYYVIIRLFQPIIRWRERSS
jgi:hypothetical protein